MDEEEAEEFELDQDDVRQLESLELGQTQQPEPQRAERAESTDVRRLIQSKDGELAILRAQLAGLHGKHQAAMDSVRVGYEKEIQRKGGEIETLKVDLERIRTQHEFEMQERGEPKRKMQKLAKPSPTSNKFGGGHVKTELVRAPTPKRIAVDQILPLIQSHRHQGENTLAFLQAREQDGSDLGSDLGSEFLREISQSWDTAEILLTVVCQTLLRMCDRCMKQEAFDPLGHAVTMLAVLLSASVEVCSSFAAVTAILATSNLKLIFAARARQEKQTYSYLEPHLWNLLQCVCFAAPSQRLTIWSHIPIDFLLTAVSSRQPLATTRAAIAILPYSITPTSVGSIVAEEQDQYESMLIDASAKILTETRGATAQEIVHVRMLYCDFCFSLLDRRPKFVNSLLKSRLVRCCATLIDAVLQQACGNADLVELISRITVLLASFPLSELDPATYHKYLLCSSRLALGGNSIPVKGYVVDAARDLLEELVTMDEADAVWEIFDTGSSPNPSA